MDTLAENYIYSSDLDQDILAETYEGDLEYMHCMFETFVETIEEEIQLLAKVIEAKRLKEVRKIIHKIKPNFSMVGLTGHYQQAITLERLCDSLDAFSPELEEKAVIFLNEVKTSRKIIHSETQKLEQALSNT
ncbi:MAG: Hpt domain-containing protein [Bacteroidota bacterium]